MSSCIGSRCGDLLKGSRILFSKVDSLKTFQEVCGGIEVHGAHDLEQIRRSETRSFFDGALLVFGQREIEIAKSFNLSINPILSASVPFACDAFGDLFTLIEQRVMRVSLESCSVDEEWATFRDWADATTADPDDVVGQSFLVDWERSNGRLPAGRRLSPKVPFLLGGTYDLSNITSVDFDEIIGFRAMLAERTAGLPDGSRVMVDTTRD